MASNHNVKKLFALPYLEREYGLLADSFTSTCTVLVKSAGTDVNPSELQRCLDAVCPYVRESLVSVAMRSYTDLYTDSEIEELIEFFSRPVAIKMASHAPMLIADYTSWFGRNSGTIKQIMVNSLKKPEEPLWGSRPKT